MGNYEDLYKKEEALTKLVYDSFEKSIKNIDEFVDFNQEMVSNDTYEEQEKSTVVNKLTSSKKKKHEIHRIVEMLYDKPYFSHMEINFVEDDETEDYFLSDCEELNQTVEIGEKGHILPFKQDDNRKISSAIFRCYQAKNGSPIKYKSNTDVIEIAPVLICDTEIEKGKLLKVNQLYPDSEDFLLKADELLEKKLSDNRNNPEFRNIISTLQLQQFMIIEDDITKSFVVQGCAGSGKSQCLIHRLFFLRAKLENEGWDKVLLITPTSLFRHYSLPLMRRYNLTNINNYSLADLYKNILISYDRRFEDRHYIFKMTEEYLPDGYLHEVYEKSNVRKIENEISNAIYKYLKFACDSIGMSIPESVNIQVIKAVIKKLDLQLKIIDEKNELLGNNTEYIENKKEYEKLTKEIEGARKQVVRIDEEIDKVTNREKHLVSLEEEISKEKAEKNRWIEHRKLRVEKAKEELDNSILYMNNKDDITAPFKYAKSLFLYKDLNEGQRYKEDEEELEILDELLSLSNKELEELKALNKSQNTIEKCENRKSELTVKRNETLAQISEMSSEAENLLNKINNIKSVLTEHDTLNDFNENDIQQSRYILNRIETIVFEQEVWNALMPIKEKYNIDTINVEELSDGRHKESRILYKSDLLFYIKIYNKLYSNVNLPNYKYICVDEGQDLYTGDYEILRELYPEAVFNIYGDTGQVLHLACGISDWKTQTKIDTIYNLNTNYRNLPAIVDFCNKKFGEDMKFIGKVNEANLPVEVNSPEEAKRIIENENITIIVKDKDAFLELCAEIKIDANKISYLDTLSMAKDGNQTECYSIFAAKGLEFSRIFVFSRHMTKKQKVVACTRTMGGLYYYE